MHHLYVPPTMSWFFPPTYKLQSPVYRRGQTNIQYSHSSLFKIRAPPISKPRGLSVDWECWIQLPFHQPLERTGRQQGDYPKLKRIQSHFACWTQVYPELSMVHWSSDPSRCPVLANAWQLCQTGRKSGGGNRQGNKPKKWKMNKETSLCKNSNK